MYQPILHLADGRLAGYEALARPANIADDGSVEGFFRTARQEGQLRDLDWLCRRAAVDGAKGIADGPFLSINLNPDALSNAQADADALVELLVAAGRTAASVVIEVVRPSSIPGVADLLTLLAPYRTAGMRIALAGVDEPDEVLLLDSTAQPDFIKLARSAVAAIGVPSRSAFAARCVARVTRGGPIPIAEGIELPDTAQQLLDLGFDLGQGYLLGRPAALDRDGRLQPTPVMDAG